MRASFCDFKVSRGCAVRLRRTRRLVRRKRNATRLRTLAHRLVRVLRLMPVIRSVQPFGVLVVSSFWRLRAVGERLAEKLTAVSELKPATATEHYRWRLARMSQGKNLSPLIICGPSGTFLSLCLHPAIRF